MLFGNQNSNISGFFCMCSVFQFLLRFSIRVILMMMMTMMVMVTLLFILVLFRLSVAVIFLLDLFLWDLFALTNAYYL